MKRALSLFVILAMLLNSFSVFAQPIGELLASTSSAAITISESSTEKRIVIESDSALENAIVYVAAYKDGVFKKMVTQTVDIVKGTNTFTITPTWTSSERDYVKVFLWDENMSPCADCITIYPPTYILSIPKNVRVEYDEIKWDAVPNAKYYTVSVNGDYEFTTANTSCYLNQVVNSSNQKLFEDRTATNKHGEVVVTVCANNNGEYMASAFSTPVTYYYVPDAGESSDRTQAEDFKIGHGYNMIEQNFSAGTQAKGVVFDLGKLLSIDDFAVSTEGGGSETVSYYFNSIDDYTSKEDNKIDVNATIGGGYGPFTANLTADLSYGIKENYTTKKHYSSYISRSDILLGTAMFEMLNSDVRVHCLSKEFLRDIKRESNETKVLNNKDLFEYLLEKYGTHVALGVQRGGNFVTSYTVWTNSEEDIKTTNEMFKLAVSANVGTFFNASANVKDQNDHTIETTSETTVSLLKSSSYGGEVDVGVDGGKASINDWGVSDANDVALGFTNNGAIALSSVIDMYETEYGNLGDNGTCLGLGYAEFVASKADATFMELYGQYTYAPPFNVEVDETDSGNVLIIDLSKYQGSGDLSSASCSYLFDGVFTVYPNMMGHRIDSVKVISSFDNSEVGEKNLIDGFSVALSNNWKRDVDIVFENVGVRAHKNGLVDKSNTNGIKTNVTYSGVNFVEMPGLSEEMYISTETAEHHFAFEFTEDEEIYLSTLCVEDDSIVLPIAETSGKLFAGWYDADNNRVTDARGKLEKNYSATGKVVLHPTWDGITYDIVLNNQNAQVSGTETIYEKYGDSFFDVTGNQIESITVPRKNGYDFYGYYKKVENNSDADATGEDCIIDKNGIIVDENATAFNKHSTVYALWLPKVYTISLYTDKNSTKVFDSFCLQYGEAFYKDNHLDYVISKIEKTPTQTGWVFTGFYDEEGNLFVNNKGIIIHATSGNTKVILSDTKLYAGWDVGKYTVTYNGNGATGGKTEASSHEYGNYKELTPNGFTKTGYTFDGWKDDRGNTYEDNEAVLNLATENGATITLYAQWKANSYTVRFNGNGGKTLSGATYYESSHTYDAEKVLTSNSFKLTGKSFNNWNTKVDGTGETFDNNESVKNLTDVNGGIVTLFAQWTDEEYTVTLDADGGNLTNNTIKVKYGQPYGKLPTPTKDGSDFAGWYYGNKEIKSTTTVDIAEGHTLKAKWNWISYTVTWNEVEHVSITVTRSSTKHPTAGTGTLKNNDPIYYGDVLSVNYTLENGFEYILKGNVSIPVTGNVGSKQIYASVQPKQYTVSWNTPTNATIVVKRTASPYKGASIGTLTNNAAIYYGDVLSVTYTPDMGYSISSQGEKSITVTGDVDKTRIYATATANNYQVVYNANGGSVSPASKTVTFGSTYGTLPTPTWRSCTFSGWYTTENSRVYDTTKVTKASDHTLIAKWSPNTTGSFDTGLRADFRVTVDGKTEYWQTGLNREALRAAGYNNVKLDITMKGVYWEFEFTKADWWFEIYDRSGNLLKKQEDGAWKTSGENLDFFTLETRTYSHTVSIDAIRDDGTIYIRYDHGGEEWYNDKTDDFILAQVILKTTAVK